ncbi:MAG: hypothetical protein KGO05_02860, partial [Chloroflexota bacterium]|nr:hypothetical protein [Chloroflexota bacterium]
MPDAATAALAKKLRLTPTTHLLALNAPEAYIAALRQPGLVAAIAIEANGAPCDAAHVFARTRAEALAGLTAAVAALRVGGVLWVMWPKKDSGVVSDLTRDTLAALALTQGWGPVSNVAVDAVWSALRLRPEVDVKRAGRPS